MEQREKHIGIIAAVPIYILSILLSRFLPDILMVSIFSICLIFFVLLRNQYFKRKKVLFIIYFLLVFSSIHFFGFCLMKIPDGETYDSPSDENASKSIAIALSLPISFIFSIVAGIMFDFWKNKSLNGNSN